jgi:hypothetical protein
MSLANGHDGPFDDDGKKPDKRIEQVKQDLIARFLTPSNKIPEHWLDGWQKWGNPCHSTFVLYS